MSQECIDQCVFYSQCKDIIDTKNTARRSIIAEKLGRYTTEDRLMETASDFVRVGEDMCKSEEPGAAKDCMIVAAAAVTNALKNA